MSAVDEAVRAAMSGDVKAVVTAPINKSHWKAAGSPFLGHTEYLAHITGARSFAMMMASPKLNVSLVTTHLPLADVAKAITVERICEVARLTDAFLRKTSGGGAARHVERLTSNVTSSVTGSRNTRIAICALNPHAGDSGALGDEEERVIIPAISILKNEGLDVSGPYPADTVFYKALQGEFGAVVAMYHDQGLVPIKTLDFRHTVNVTLGLPFVRTSPDHGTAEDIASKGIADHGNLVEAIKMAVKLTEGT